MVVKIVILNWNGRRHLERFLPSVMSAGGGAGVVVADNGSSDGSLEFLRANYPEIELIAFDDNYGYAGGYNKALAAVEADAFVLLNSDVETPEGWLEPLVAMMASDAGIASVSPKILAYDSKDHFEYAGAAGGFIDVLGYPFCRGRILNAIEKDDGRYDDSREVFWSSGACMLVRASAFRDAGGFDEDFFAHMEEIDLCWRFHLKGYKVMVEPASHVYHVGGGTLPNNSPHKLYLNYRNNLSMLFKNLRRRGLVITMLVRLVLDGASAGVFLLQGRRDLFKVVWNAHCDFHRSRHRLHEKRRAVQGSRVTGRVKTIFRGSIVWRYMTGRRSFGNLMSRSR